jgi:hypothetical protein
MIYTIRNPLDGVASMLDVAQKIWESAGMAEGFQHQEWAYRTVKAMYAYPLSWFAQADESTYDLLVHDDLLQRPSEVIEAIYEKFGYRMEDAFLTILREEDEKQRGYRSRHKYSLEQFGLSREQIVEDFREVFDRFGFDRRSPKTEASTQASS